MEKETLYDKMYDKIDDLAYSSYGEIRGITSAALACAEIAKDEAIEFAEYLLKAFNVNSTGILSGEPIEHLYSIFKLEDI